MIVVGQKPEKSNSPAFQLEEDCRVTDGFSSELYYQKWVNHKPYDHKLDYLSVLIEGFRWCIQQRFQNLRVTINTYVCNSIKKSEVVNTFPIYDKYVVVQTYKVSNNIIIIAKNS